jgi:hypothetical protein
VRKDVVTTYYSDRLDAYRHTALSIPTMMRIEESAKKIIIE